MLAGQIWLSKFAVPLSLVFCRYFSVDLGVFWLGTGSPCFLRSGEDPHVMHAWPELAAMRDIFFYFKYALCTDLRVFSQGAFTPQSAILKWEVKMDGRRHDGEFARMHRRSQTHRSRPLRCCRPCRRLRHHRCSEAVGLVRRG